MRLIDADTVKFRFPHGYDHNGILMVPFYSCKCSIDNAPTVDAVPLSEMTALRDTLYDMDAITFRGLAKINQLIAKYGGQGISNTIPNERRWLETV